MTVALVGNPNCGKTAIFNCITGENQHVGNFPGVTVSCKTGMFFNRSDITVVDLPGVYSLSPCSEEEKITLGFLTESKPDCIINVVDGTNMERSLYLCMQLYELNIPIVLAVNMMDRVHSCGGKIDIKKLSSYIDVCAVAVSATYNSGMKELEKSVLSAVLRRKIKKENKIYSGILHDTVENIKDCICKNAEYAGVPLAFTAVRLVEGDFSLFEKLSLSADTVKGVSMMIRYMEEVLEMDGKTAISRAKYKYVSDICKNCIFPLKRNIRHSLSVKADGILMNRFFALPIFFLIMIAVFWLSFGSVGQSLNNILISAIERMGEASIVMLNNRNISPVLVSLWADAIIRGVGAVLSLMPTVVIMLFLLTLLEDCGYMARVAVIMDSFMTKMGLSGRCFVPALLGLGCTVPAVASARILAGEKERKSAILLLPFISCSAKLPVYSAVASFFYKEYTPLVIFSLYSASIGIGIMSCLFKSKILKPEENYFIMELPDYCLPGVKSILKELWEKSKEFLLRVASTVLIASVVIWVLQNFSITFEFVYNIEESILANIGKFISPVFRFAGFDDWRISAALLSGITAKETVLSTLSVLVGKNGITSCFSRLSAASFMVFVLLYTPCIAAIKAIRIEIGIRWAATTVVYHMCIAWLMSVFVYKAGEIFINLL